MPSLPNLSPPGNRKYRWYGLIKEGQEDFSGGAFFGQERVPANACEDIINGFVDQDGGIARRGGSAYRGVTIGSSSASHWLWDGYLAGGRVTLQARSQDSVYILTPGESAWINRGVFPAVPSRPVAVGGVLWMASTGAGEPAVVAIGSETVSGLPAPTGTVNVNQGVTLVTGSGTNFTSALRVGQVLSFSDLHKPSIAIAKIISDTQLHLVSNYPDPTATGFVWPGNVAAGDKTIYLGSSSAAPGQRPFANRDTTYSNPVLGAAAGRVLYGLGDRIAFSDANTGPSVFNSTDYHELQDGSSVVGLQGLRDSCLVFTTSGVFVITNLSYDLTDALGNVQQSLQSLYPNYVLHRERGVASWAGAVIAPMTDGVYLLDGSSPPVGLMNEAILPLYRSYVEAGYSFGTATVWKSHYFLPVILSEFSNSTWVDTLVCDLRSKAWTRWDGHGGKIAGFATRPQDTTNPPRLLGLESYNGTRLLDLNGSLAPSSAVKNDADGSTHQLKVTFRTLSAGTIPVQWRKFRARFDADDAGSDDPQLQCELATGRPGNAFTTLSGTAPEGETTFNWQTSKKARAIRFRVTSQHAASKFVIRSFEAFYRYTGRT